METNFCWRCIVIVKESALKPFEFNVVGRSVSYAGDKALKYVYDKLKVSKETDARMGLIIVQSVTNLGEVIG